MDANNACQHIPLLGRFFPKGIYLILQPDEQKEQAKYVTEPRIIKEIIYAQGSIIHFAESQ